MQALFEQGLVYILKRVLGEFVEDSARLQERIQVGISNGSIILEHLVLKNSILSLVDVPISLSYGSIGKFELKIPWSKLGVEPIIVNIEKINVLVEPKYEWSRGAVDKREQAVKQAKLAAAELFAAKRLVNKTRSYTDFAKSWFMSSFVNKIIDNIQITVREVHFRYEDHVSCPSRFCIGFSLECLTVRTRDEELTKQMEEQFPPVVKNIYDPHAAEASYEKYNIITAGSDVFNKVIQVTNLAMYWNPLVASSLDVCSCCFIGRPIADIQSFMSRTLAMGTAYIDKPRHHYLLLPVDIHTYLSVSLNTTTGAVKATVNVFMSNIALNLEDRQLREIISMTTYMANFAKLERFSEFRPTKIVAEDPKAWWRYAINAVIVQIRVERKSTLTWKQLNQRVHDKLVYVELWKSRLVSSQSVINQLNTFDTTKRTLDRATNVTYQSILKRVRKEIEESKKMIESLPTVKATGNMKVSGTLHSTPMSKTSVSGSTTSHNGKSAAAVANAAHLNSIVSPVNVASAASHPLTKEGIELLKALEYDLSFEDIVQFRSKAEKNLSLEAKQKSWLDGLTSWVTGGKPSNDSVEEKLKLFEALKYDPDRVFRGGNQEVDLHEVMANVSVTLKKGSFMMALSTPDVNTFQSSLPFLKLEFDDLKNKNIIMGDGSHVKVFLSLHDFEAFEVLSNNNMKKFVSRRTLAHDLSQSGSVVDSTNDDARSIISSSVRSLTGGRRGSPKESTAAVSGAKPTRNTPPLFSSSIDIFPPNKEKDTAVYLTLEELEVWISPFATWFDPMMAFVTWPEDLKYWSEMEMTTLNQLADIKAVFDAKIEYMMNNHMNIVIEAKVKAPVIIITDSDFKDDTADVLVIDLGSITLKTEKLAKAQRQKLMDSQLVAAGGSNASEGGSVRTSNSNPSTPVVSGSKRMKSFRTPTVTQSIMEEENEEEEEPPQEVSPQQSNIVGTQGTHDDFEVLNASAITDAPNTPMAGNNQLFSTPPVVELADENYRFTDTNIKGRRSSVYHRYLNADGTRANPPLAGEGVGNSYYGQSVNTLQAPETEELNEEDLFDVFMCKMKDSEIYLINSALVHNVLAEIEPDKTVIVDRSEMSIEIQVSVLPWDSELPPVKLFVDMDELNVQLSEPKLLRLNQFAVGLVNRSNNIINSNMKSINKFNNLMKKRAHDSMGARMRTSGIGASFLTSGASQLQPGSRLSTGSIYRAQRVSHKTNVDFNVPDDASTFYDAKSEMGSVRPGDSERRSVASSRLSRLIEGGRHVVSDDERNSDDSFFSVEENYSTKDRIRQAEALAAQIAEKEAAQIKLMSDIRVTEADPSKAPLLDLLRLDLADCEKELKYLRIRFIELRMHTNELEQFIGSDANRNVAYSDAELAARRQMVDQMIFPEEGVHRQDLGHKRNLIHASVFKITQEPNQYSNADVKYKPTDEKLSEFMNKKLVYAKVNIAVVNVDLQCVTKAPPASALSESRVPDAQKSRRSNAFSLTIPSIPVERTVIFRLRLSGIHLTLKHKTMDTKVLFILHQIDLHDFSLNNSIMPFNPITTDKTGSYGLQAGANVLVSSEPSLFGMFGNPLSSKYLQNGVTDFVRVKYDVAYADTSLPVDDPNNPFPVTQHNVEVVSGFLGVNVEQEKISLLLDTVTQLAAQIAASAKATSAQIPSPLVPKVTVKDTSSPLEPGSSAAKLAAELDAAADESTGFSSSVMLQTLPSIAVKFDLECISVSLLQRSAPLLTASMWQIRTNVSTRMDQMVSELSLADVTVDYHSVSSDIPVSLMSRQTGSLMPFLTLDAQLEIEESHVYMPNLTVLLRTVPVEMVLNLDAVHDLIKYIIHGPVYKWVNEMPIKPAPVAVKPSSDVIAPGSKGLDGILNPLLDFCNGVVTLNVGGVTLKAPSSSEYVHSRTDFTFSVVAVDCRTAWGDYCRTNGLESSLMVKNIDVKVSSWSLCDAFNVSASVAMLPETLLGAFPNSSVTSPEFEFSTEFVPPTMAAVSRNEMQIAVGISPIALHCNDAIISEVITWIANTDSVLQKIAGVLASDAPPLNQSMADLLQSSGVPVALSSVPMALGFVLTSEVLIYELMVSVEVCREAPPTRSQHNGSFELRTPQRTPMKVPGHLQRMDHGSSFSFLNVDSSVNDRISAVFKFTTRHITIVSNIEDSIADTDVVEDTEELFDYQEDHAKASGHSSTGSEKSEVQSFIESRLTIATIDLEFLAGSHKSYKRMLCNSSLFSEASESQPFVVLSVEVSSLLDLQVSTVISNVHCAVIADGLVALLALLQVYSTAANPQPIDNRREVLTPSSKNFIGGDSQSSSQGRRRGKEFKGESASMYEFSSAGGGARSSTQNRDQSYSHPSSVPMSTTAEATRAPNAFANLQAAAPSSLLPTTILNRLSFTLPVPLKSLSFKAEVVSLHVWVPGDGGSGSLSLCCSIETLTVCGSHQNIQWSSYSSLKESGGVEESQTFWTSSLSIGSLGIFLTDVVPLELTFAVPPLSAERMNVRQSEKTAEYKVMVSPFDINAQYELHLVSCGSQPSMAPLKSGNFVLIDSNMRYEVRQIVSVLIQDITVHIYLDYRPYLRLYDYVSSPLNTYFAAVSLTANAVQPVRRDAHSDNAERLSVVQSEYTPIKSSTSKKSNKNSRDEETDLQKYNSIQKMLGDKKLGLVGSVFDLFSSLPEVASLSLTVQQDNIAVYVINDIYVQQPVSIARLSVSDLDVRLNVFLPPRQSGLLLVSLDQTLDEESKKPRSDSATSVSSSRNLFDFSLISKASHAFKDLTGSGSQPFVSQRQLSSSPVNVADQASDVSPSMLTVVAKSCIRIDYYNQKLIATEPLIEPFNSEFVFKLLNSSDAMKKNGPILTLLNETTIESGSSLSTTQIDSAVSRLIVENYFPSEAVLRSSCAPPPPCLEASTFGNINVNLTVALFESAFLTMKALNYLEASSASGGANLKDVSMLAIRNETGMLLKYWTKEKSHTEQVPTNTEIPLNLVEFDLDTCGLGINKDCWLGGAVGSSATAARSIHVSVQRPSGQFYPSLLDIPLEGVGCRLFVLEIDAPEPESETEGVVAEKPKHRRSRPRALHHHAGQRESGAELKDAVSTPNSTIVALELISKAGIKTLLIRSTMRLYNSTKIAFKVELVSGYRNIKREVLWESIIPPGNGIAVPAHLCNVENGRFIVKPSFDFSKSGSQWAQQYYRVSSQRNVVFSAELPVPTILGSNNAHTRVTQDEHDDYQDGNNYIFNERDDALPRNFIMWRKLQTQKKATAETLSYSHWVRFNKNNIKSTDYVPRVDEIVAYCQEKSESICCNVNVESRGIPHLSKTRSSESCLLRTLVFAPSITVTNLMAHGIEVAITPNISKYTAGKITHIESLFKSNQNLLNIIPSTQLKPSETWDCVSYHSSEKILLSLKLTHDISSNGGFWSTFLTIPGSRVSSTEVTSYTLEVPYRNGSVLPVQVEVTDTGGARSIVIFAPYWVVTSSFLPVQFQHESRVQAPGSSVELGALNGEDGLAADQVFEDKKKLREDLSHVPKKHQVPIVGLGHSRGVNGVVLGPGTPLRGLTDVLKASSGGVISRFTFKKQDEKLSPMGLLHKYLNNAEPDRESEHSATGVEDQDAHLDVAYRLMQCGYSNLDKRSCHLRLGRDDQWGNFFSLDRVGNTEVDLKTVTDTASVKQLTQHFSFGVVTTAGEAPFHRTKIVTIVDRLLLVNSVGQAIEVRQFAQESVFSLKNNDETALWWRPGVQNIQVRLARYGWSWSGKFSVTIEGEIPIRLRNDFDNTVFFVLVEVLKQGPRVCIVFKSGEKFSPYRFENHTLETFKIKQKGQEPVTNLLPYHCSAYAWDEPLAQHMFTIEMAKNGSNADNQWTTVGTFSFDRLETIVRKSNDHLVLKVLAQGPTRVLQISDSRSLKRQETLGSSPSKRFRSKSIEKNAELTPTLLSGPSLRPVLFHVSVHIAGLGVSLVDQTPQELIYLSMAGCNVDLTIGEGFQGIDLDLECLQVDNQLWTTPYPSLFYPLLRDGASVSPVNQRRAGVHNNQLKFLSLSVVRDFEYSGIEFIPLFKLTLSPFDINIEGTILVRLYNMGMSIKDLFIEANSNSAISTKQFDWLDEISRSSTSAAAAITYQDLRKLEAIHRETPEKSAATTNAATGSTRKTASALSIAVPKNEGRSGVSTGTTLASLKSGLGQQRSTLTHSRIKKILEGITTLNANVYKPSPKVYIKQLEISEIRLNISMNATVASDYLHDNKTWWWVAIKQVLMSVGSTLVKLENCPIKFYSFTLGHSYCSEKELLNKMINNYTGQAIVQSMNIIFSSEWLGNPLLLFRTLSEGLYDFIREPVEGLTKSPSAFLLGILRGTSSLVRRTVASICTTAGHFSAVGQVALLNFGIVEPYAVARPAIQDAEDGSTALIDLRSRNRTNNTVSLLPSTLLKGIAFGARQFFMDPYVGFSIDGIQGALIGSVKGVLGAFARPMYGALGYFSASMNSLSFELLPRYHAAQKLRIQRFRPPRFLHSPNLPLQVYSVDENVGQELLLRIHKGEYRYEGYVCHSRVKEGYVLIMTKMRIMLVNESFEFCELLWQCAIRTILSIEVHYDKTKADEIVVSNASKVSRSSPATVKALEDAKVNVVGSPEKKQATAKWNCQLVGEPKLHLYYRPLPSQEAKLSNASENVATSASSPSVSEPAGLRFAQKILHLLSHDQLLSILHQLLTLSPTLLSPDITVYLTEAGVDQSLLKAFNNKKKSTSVSLRSPTKGEQSSFSIAHGALYASGFTSPRRLSQWRSTSSVQSGASGASSDFFGARHTEDVDSIAE